MRKAGFSKKIRELVAKAVLAELPRNLTPPSNSPQQRRVVTWACPLAGKRFAGHSISP